MQDLVLKALQVPSQFEIFQAKTSLAVGSPGPPQVPQLKGKSSYTSPIAPIDLTGTTDEMEDPIQLRHPDLLEVFVAGRWSLKEVLISTLPLLALFQGLGLSLGMQFETKPAKKVGTYSDAFGGIKQVIMEVPEVGKVTRAAFMDLVGPSQVEGVNDIPGMSTGFLLLGI